MTNGTDFFDNVGGAGAPSALLKNVGDFVHGEIVEMFKKEYVPFGKTEPEKRSDGSNAEQLVVILQTTFRNWQNVTKVPKVDPTDQNSADKAPSEDDGKRAVYVPEGKNIQFAIVRALRAAQAPFVTGGTLGVRVANLRDTGKGNPLKEHEAVYKAPDASAGFFPAQEAQAPAQAAPPVQQVQQQYPAPTTPPQATPPVQQVQQQAPAPFAQPSTPVPAQDPFAQTAPAAPPVQQQAPAAQPAAPAQVDPWTGQPVTQQAPPF